MKWWQIILLALGWLAGVLIVGFSLQTKRDAFKVDRYGRRKHKK